MSNHPDRYRKDDPDHKFVQSRRWREKLRPRQLARQPLCVHCRLLGLVKAATQVDHIQRPYGDTELLTAPENMQSLCFDHHLKKSNWERAGKTKLLVIGVTLQGELIVGAAPKRK
jgi:5-methylcytosine-specific restriction protein A